MSLFVRCTLDDRYTNGFIYMVFVRCCVLFSREACVGDMYRLFALCVGMVV